jgi:hypothetical protein
MNKLLIFSCVAISILEASSAFQLSAHPVALERGASVTAERRAAQSHSADRDTDAPCTTRIFVMTKTDGSRTLRKSVDCEE